MYQKHAKFSQKEIEIINRGKEGNLKNLDEMNLYYYYLSKFKDEYIAELKTKYMNKSFTASYIGGVCLCGLGGGTTCLVSLFCGNFVLAGALAGLAFLGISVPDFINYIKANNEYKNETTELAQLIQKESDELRAKRELEEQKKKEEEIVNSKKDPFIFNISKDLSEILSSKYEGYEKEYIALTSLANRYLKIKKLMQTTSSVEVLSNYPEFNKIILGIESKISKNIKIKERMDLDIQELETTINVFDTELPEELMSLEELMGYIPKEEARLELLKAKSL